MIDKKILRWVPAILYAILIFYLSSLPQPIAPEKVIGLSFGTSIKHFIEYFIFGALLLFALWEHKKRVMWVVIIGVLYAISDEIHQNFTGRAMELKDVMVDTIGIFASLVIVKWKSNKKHKKSKKASKKR